MSNITYEDWMYIKGYEGIYIISNRGRIFSMTRTITIRTRKWICKRPQKGVEIKYSQLPSKYVVICLHRDGGDLDISIHRLVALHFIPNQNNKPWVNHCDGIRFNNVWFNLEWTTISENHTHAYKELGRINPAAKPIVMINKDGIEMARFENCTEAAKVLNKDRSTIADHVRGKIKISREGYTFKLASLV